MLSHMDEVLGTRYCETTAMKASMIMTRAMLDELVESCSAEDVGKLQDARGAPSGPVSSMISTPRQRRAWRRLRFIHRALRINRVPPFHHPSPRRFEGV